MLAASHNSIENKQQNSSVNHYKTLEYICSMMLRRNTNTTSGRMHSKADEKYFSVCLIET
jgi:hypothetical protein